MIRVLIAEDQAMVRGALASLLALEDDIEVVAEVARGDAVLETARARQADVALLDIEMPGGDGISAAAELARELPETRSLILTTFGRPGYLRRAIESGAGGFLLKDAPAEQLADAVREVHAGRRVIDPGLAAEAIADGVSPLTEREHDVLVAATEHATAAEIAARLFLSEGTVRNYLSAAIRKLGARNRAEALRIAEERAGSSERACSGYNAGAALYSASVTWSPQVALVPSSSTSTIARCVMKRSGAAPCQCSSPGAKNTRSPGRMTSIEPPRPCARPTPSVT